MPSRGASSAFFVPMEPDAPGWFTTTNLPPIAASISAATRRAIWSVEPPAAHGTISVTGRSGFQL